MPGFEYEKYNKVIKRLPAPVSSLELTPKSDMSYSELEYYRNIRKQVGEMMA